MRHLKKKIAVRNKNGFQKCLYKNLLKSLFYYGKIKLTLKKGRILVYLAKKIFYKFSRIQPLFNQMRYLRSIFNSKNVIEKFFKYPKKKVFLFKYTIRLTDRAKIAFVKLE